MSMLRDACSRYRLARFVGTTRFEVFLTPSLHTLSLRREASPACLMTLILQATLRYFNTLPQTNTLRSLHKTSREKAPTTKKNCPTNCASCAGPLEKRHDINNTQRSAFLCGHIARDVKVGPLNARGACTQLNANGPRKSEQAPINEMPEASRGAHARNRAGPRGSHPPGQIRKRSAHSTVLAARLGRDSTNLAYPNIA